jgi:hypothetical protein
MTDRSTGGRTPIYRATASWLEKRHIDRHDARGNCHPQASYRRTLLGMKCVECGG